MSSGNSISKALGNTLVILVLALTVLSGMSYGNCYNSYAEEASEPEELTAVDDEALGIEVNSEKAACYNVDTGEIIYSKDGDKKIYPASTTKILTAIIAIENCDLDEVITVSENAVYGIDSSSSHIALEVGEELTMEQALYGLLLCSGNDAAVAIAEHVAGSVDEFADMMNEKAAEIGATNSHFVNPHGLYDEDHYSTPADMARIMGYCSKNETFIKIDSTSEYTIPKTNKKTKRVLWNDNNMLPGRMFEYEPTVCGKRGYVTESKFNLVTYAKTDDTNLTAYTAGAGNNMTCSKDTARILKYFFANYENAELNLDDTGVDSLTIEEKEVPVYAKDDIIAMLPTGYDASKIEYKAEKDQNVLLPVKADDKVGTLNVIYDGQTLGTADLYASEDVGGNILLIILGILAVLFIIIALILFILIRKHRRNTRRGRSRAKNRPARK